MIEQRYGHIIEDRSEVRSEVVEFRIENHKKAVKDRLAALRGADNV